MNIFGENIVLRAIDEKDAPLLLDMINDPSVEKNVGGSSFPVSFLTQLEWIKKQATIPDSTHLRCIIECLGTGKSVGMMALSDIDHKNGTAMSHIKLSSKARGKGYAHDAHRTMLTYAFQELRLNCIYAEVLENNKASLKLFERLHFKQEGILRQRIYKQGQCLNVISLSILKDEFIC